MNGVYAKLGDERVRILSFVFVGAGGVRAVVVNTDNKIQVVPTDKLTEVFCED